MTFVQKTRAFYVDEIDTRLQRLLQRKIFSKTVQKSLKLTKRLYLK